jgi:hypothetical protein
MKCANLNCNRSLGLVSYPRGWFGKRRYCSRGCRDALPADAPKPLQRERHATTYFEWLFLQPAETPRPRLMPAAIRSKAR